MRCRDTVILWVPKWDPIRQLKKRRLHKSFRGPRYFVFNLGHTFLVSIPFCNKISSHFGHTISPRDVSYNNNVYSCQCIDAACVSIAAARPRLRAPNHGEIIVVVNALSWQRLEIIKLSWRQHKSFLRSKCFVLYLFVVFIFVIKCLPNIGRTISLRDSLIIL